MRATGALELNQFPVRPGSGQDDVRPRERLTAFFLALGALDAAQVDALQRSPGRLSRRALELDPDFLDAVASGRWTAQHDDLAHQVHEDARTAAGGLTGLLHRRALAAAIEDAALVVLSDCVLSEGSRAPVLCPGLRSRLAAPWLHATGCDPSRATADV